MHEIWTIHGERSFEAAAKRRLALPLATGNEAEDSRRTGSGNVFPEPGRSRLIFRAGVLGPDLNVHQLQHKGSRTVLFQ